MMNNIKTTILIILSIAIGLLIGKFIFKSDDSHISHQPSAHDDEEIFTCSMHPQIRQNEPGICPICEMDLIPVDDSGSSQDPTILKMTPESAKLAQIATMKTKKEINGSSRDINVEGTIKLDESMSNVQTAHVGGRIEKIYVTYTGQYVRKGQLIARVYTPGLLTASKELLTAVKNEDRLPGLKDAAIQKIKNWKITDDQIEEILNSGKPIQEVNIFADHSGYVTQYNVSTGDHLMEGEVLFRLANTNRLWIEFNVFESDLSSIRIGQKINFSTPSSGNKIFNSLVSFIDPILDEQSRTVTVRATMNNPENKFKPGMLVKGLIKGKTEGKGSLIIPKSAVLWTGKKSVVYVDIAEGELSEFQFKEVVIGQEKGDYYTITEGLTEGEEVVINGAFAIDAAAQLQNQYSMMNNNVTIKSNTLQSVPDYIAVTPEVFRTSIGRVAESYINLKDAFVLTDNVATVSATSEIINLLEEVDMTLIEGDAHGYWMEIKNSLNAHLNVLAKNDDIEVQRKQFEFISELIVQSLKAFGVTQDTFYVQHCPMAFDNRGANWISKEKEIRNPYFGDKMLKCGIIQDTITENLQYLQTR